MCLRILVKQELPFFYYTNRGQQDVIVRKKEMYDGAVPSGNSVMAYNLLSTGCSTFFDIKNGKKEAIHMLSSTWDCHYPVSCFIWNMGLPAAGSDLRVIRNCNCGAKLKKNCFRNCLRIYTSPNRVILVSEYSDPAFPVVEW